MNNAGAASLVERELFRVPADDLYFLIKIIVGYLVISTGEGCGDACVSTGVWVCLHRGGVRLSFYSDGATGASAGAAGASAGAAAGAAGASAGASAGAAGAASSPLERGVDCAPPLSRAEIRCPSNIF
jgi:hypothetical protein